MKSIHSSYQKWIPWMQRALQLASLADGQTSPNPVVGAIILNSNGRLVGEGFHRASGMPHAEIEALKQAKEEANGGTLVVTLEPCCHEGKTPPCTDAVIKSGIKKVVVAMQDPDKRVAGKGLAKLQSAGIDVICGVLEDKAAYQNRAFIFRSKNNRPWGILKWAMSIDGRTSLENGESKWISNSNSREFVHKVRAKSDAVIIGGETLRKDNPLLTSRGLSETEPIRVVLTKNLNLPKEANLWDTKVARTLIATARSSQLKKFENAFPIGPERLFLDCCEPKGLAEALAAKGLNRVLWECGPNLATEAIKQDCIQELIVVIAPKLLGGSPSRTPLSNFGFSSMAEVFILNKEQIIEVGHDLIIKLGVG